MLALPVPRNEDQTSFWPNNNINSTYVGNDGALDPPVMGLHITAASSRWCCYSNSYSYK